MLESKIGKYVRTEYGYILENTVGGHGDIIEKLANEDKHYEFEYGKIAKHSDKLTDLIEDNDILEVEISEEWVNKEDSIRFIIVGQTYNESEINEALENGMYKIKSRLTKEQYAMNCFKG